MFCALQFNQLISTEITNKLSIKLPRKQIDLIAELVDSKMSLLVPDSIQYSNRIEQKVFNKLARRFESEKTIVSVPRYFSENQWIVDVSYGRSALFSYEVPLKTATILHAHHLKNDTKLRFLQEEFGPPYLLTVGSSRKLPKKFRGQLNLR